MVNETGIEPDTTQTEFTVRSLMDLLLLCNPDVPVAFRTPHDDYFGICGAELGHRFAVESGEAIEAVGDVEPERVLVLTGRANG